MSKYLHELCCCIIEDHYGEFYARIYFQLTHNGRYAATHIAQKSHLPLRQVKAGLAALVQLRLIYHHTTSEGASTYQANTKTTYDIIRLGKLIEVARKKHGDLAVKIVSEASLLGFTTVAELQDRVVTSLSHNASILNGSSNETTGDQSDEMDVQPMIKNLIRTGFLSYVRTAHFQTEFDASQDIEANLKRIGLGSAVKGRKAQLEYEERIAAEVRNVQSVETSEVGFVPLISTAQKRFAEDIPNGKEKRLKAVNGSTIGRSNGIGSDLQATILVGVSYNNFVAHLRNEYLSDIVMKNLGSRYSKVIRTVLSQVPVSNPYNVPPAEHWVDLTLVRDQLNKTSKSGLPNGKHLTNGSCPHENGDESGVGNDYFSYGDLDRHLASLSESFFNCLQGGYSKDQWKINQQELRDFIRQQESTRILGNRLGPPSLRVIRMLIEKGKLDEKTLQETGLLGAKELRQTLADLSQMGFIDLQEVPREAQRQPNRTIFLWFYDSERVRKVQLETLYKAMTRLMQRLRIERKELASTLEKVERSDVKGVEDQMLPGAELRVWKRWQKKEAWLLGELSRLDDSIAVLRDL